MFFVSVSTKRHSFWHIPIKMLSEMIEQEELPGYIGVMLPELASECRKQANAYHLVHVFLDYMFGKIREHNISAVQECLKVADQLYSRGSEKVKCAIEYVFVFSLSHLPADDAEEREMIMQLLPDSLHTVYMNQVLHHGV